MKHVIAAFSWPRNLLYVVEAMCSWVGRLPKPGSMILNKNVAVIRNKRIVEDDGWYLYPIVQRQDGMMTRTCAVCYPSWECGVQSRLDLSRGTLKGEVLVCFPPNTPTVGPESWLNREGTDTKPDPQSSIPGTHRVEGKT